MAQARSRGKQNRPGGAVVGERSTGQGERVGIRSGEKRGGGRPPFLPLYRSTVLTHCIASTCALIRGSSTAAITRSTSGRVSDDSAALVAASKVEGHTVGGAGATVPWVVAGDRGGGRRGPD